MGGINVVEKCCGQTGLTSWVIKMGGKIVWKKLCEKIV